MKKLLLITLILVVVLSSCLLFAACDTTNKSVKVIVQFPTNCGAKIKDEVSTTKSCIYNDGVSIDSVACDSNTIFFYVDNHSTVKINIKGYNEIESKVNSDNFVIDLIPKENTLTLAAFNETTPLNDFNIEVTSLNAEANTISKDLNNTDSTLTLKSGLYKFKVTSSTAVFKEETIYINDSKDLSFYGFSKTYPLTVSAKTITGEQIQDATFYSLELENITQNKTINVDKTITGKITVKSELYDFDIDTLEFNRTSNELVFIGTKKKIDILVKITDQTNTPLTDCTLTCENASFTKQDDNSYLATIDIDTLGSVTCAKDNVTFKQSTLSFSKDNTILEFKAVSFTYNFNITSKKPFLDTDLSFFSETTKVEAIKSNGFYYITMPTPFDKIHLESDIYYSNTIITFGTFETLNLNIKTYLVSIPALFKYKDDLIILDNGKEIMPNFNADNVFVLEKLVTESGTLELNITGFKKITLYYSLTTNNFTLNLEKEPVCLHLLFNNKETIHLEDFQANASYTLERLDKNHFVLTLLDETLTEITLNVNSYIPYVLNDLTQSTEITITLIHKDDLETEESPDEPDKEEGYEDITNPPIQEVYYTVSGSIFVDKNKTDTEIEQCINDFLNFNSNYFAKDYSFSLK